MWQGSTTENEGAYVSIRDRSEKEEKTQPDGINNKPNGRGDRTRRNLRRHVGNGQRGLENKRK